MQAGQPSDFDSTSAALRVLTETAAPEAKRAAAWLNQKLKNTWFEETEREARAFAFEAVASRHEADLSALRYFAEKSRDKNLSASSQVALARALAQSGDAEAAGYWFELARKTLANAPEEEAIRALYFFSAHGKEGIGTVLSVMNALKMEEVSSSFPSSARLLLALSQTVASDGSWVVQVDGGESKHTGFWSLPLSSSTVKNMAARPLYVTAFLKGKEGGGVQEKGEQGVSLIPTFYRLSGEKVVEGDFLLRQEPYLLLLKMVCHSACPQEMRVNLPFKAVLDAQTIGGGDESVARSVFPWLGDNIGSLEGWSQTPTSFGFVLKEIKKEKTVALLVKPLYAGTFTLPLAQIRSDEKDVLFDQPFVRVKIQ